VSGLVASRKPSPIPTLMFLPTRLESICLGHIHGDPNQPDDPHGHTFTATMMLESCNMPHNDKTRQAAPVAILDRLLRLSPELCPGTEQTPVQIWEHIQNQPYSGQIDAQRLHLLADKLRDAAKCHGYVAIFLSYRNRLDPMDFEKLTKMVDSEQWLSPQWWTNYY
jgi:hypothetical protein